MLRDFFVTKVGMTQAWTKDGRRLAVTRCQVTPNIVVGSHNAVVVDPQSHVKRNIPATIIEVGFGNKKLKNVSKPLRSKLEQGGFSFGVKHVRGMRILNLGEGEVVPTAGTTLEVNHVFEVGDVVRVQGVSKGKGFTGAMKRHGFHGGPATHGQSDRARAVGSIGAGTTPGRVWKGKKMPGHSGVETKTVTGLVVIYLNPDTGEVWLSGPVPGHANAHLRISKTGEKKNIDLDMNASGIQEPKQAEPVATTEEEATTEVETTVEPTVTEEEKA
jgi:large subunit ribosomal protein L3